MRNSFILHLDSLSVLDELTDEQAGKLLKACYSFNKNEDVELDQLLKIVFTPFKNQFVRDAEKYKKTCEKRALAGSVGGKQKAANVANASKCKQDLAKLADSDSKNKSDSDSLDYSCLRMSDEDVLECIRIRKKNSKTAKQGNLTQRIVDKLAKEFELARYIGWSNAEILDEWECRGWLSFESGWIKPKQPTQQIPESERPNLDKAFDLIFNEWHNKNGMMEARQAFKCKFANFTRQQLIGEMEHMDAYKEYALEKIKSGDKTFIGFDNMKFSTFIEKSRWLDLTKEELGIE